MARIETSRTEPDTAREHQSTQSPDQHGGDGSAQTGSRSDESERRGAVRYEGAGVAAGFVALLVAAGLVLIVVGQNNDEVPFEFLWWGFEVSLAVLLLATAFVVLLVAEAIGLVWRRRRRRMRELTARGARR